MKRVIGSLVGSFALVSGLLVSAPGVMAEEPSTAVARSQMVSIAAATPSQADADAACSATPQPDADDTRAWVNQDDSSIICEVVFTSPTSWARFGGGNYNNQLTKRFYIPNSQPDRLDLLAVGSGASGFLGNVTSQSGNLLKGDGGPGGQVVVLEDMYLNYAGDLPPGGDIRVQVPAGAGLQLDGSEITPADSPLYDQTENTSGGAAGFASFFIPSAQGGKATDGNQESGNSGNGLGGEGNGGSYWGPGFTPTSGSTGGAAVGPNSGLFSDWQTNRPVGLAASFGAGGGGGDSGIGGSSDAGNGADGTSPATSGAANSGAGGGGGDVANAKPGAGGSGLVVIRYIPAAVPPDPQSVTATSTVAGQAQLVVTPGDGFAQDDSYVVESSDGQIQYGTFDDTDISIGSLTPGSSYTFRVAAVNTVGQSAGFATSNAVTIASLSAPTSVSVSRTNSAETLDVVWVSGTQPVGACNSSLLYQIRYSTDGGSNWTLPDVVFSDDTVTKSGLDASLDYLVEVAAACTNPNAVSAQTRSATAVSPSATNAPSAVSAATGPNVGSIAITVSVDSPPAIGAFAVELSTDGGTTWVFDDTYAYSPSGIIVGGLTPGTSYLARVATQPVTLDDTSNFTEATQAAEARPNPPADPLGLTAAVGITAGQVDLEVAAGAGSIASYLVEWSVDDSRNWTTVGSKTTGSDDTQITLTAGDGLIDGSVLYFRVFAVNSVDDSSALPAYDNTAVTVPSADAPVAGSVLVSRDDTANQLVVSVDDTLPVGKRFIVQVSDDSGVTWAAPGGDDTFTASPMFVSLSPAPAVDDTFVVRVAIADPDGSVISAWTVQTGPAVSPSATDAPAAVTATMSTTTVGAVDVTVAQVGSNDDSVVIQYTDDTSTNPIVWTTAPGGPFTNADMPRAVTGLTGGATYVFRAATQPPNFDDTSNWVLSNAAEARPGVPDDPAGLAAAVGSAAGEVDLVVTAAGSGPAVAQYLVEWSADDSQNWSTLGSKLTGSDDTEITLTSADGLVDDSVLYFRVYAVNSVDDSSTLPAYDNTAVTVPAADAPAAGSVSVTRDDTAAQLVVSVDDSLPVGKRFIVQVSDDSGVTWGAPTGDDTFAASPMFVNVTETNADDTFVVRVAIAEADGTLISAWTAQTGPAVSPSATDAPASVTAVMGSGTGEVDVTVTQVVSGDDSVVIQFTDDTVAPYTGWQTASGSPFPGTPSTITVGNSDGLVTGTAYVFQAATQPPAFDDTSNFRVMTGSPVLARPTVPDQPSATAVAGDGAVYVTAEAANTGGTPTGFTVTAQGSGETCSITGTSGYCVVTNLTNGTGYTFDVVATNAGGNSTAAQLPVTPAASTAPFPPVISSIVSGNGQLIVTVAETPGGGPLTKFEVDETGGASCEIVPPLNSCALTGLTDGAYTVSAKAVGGGGTSAATTESVTLTSNGTTPPDAPEVSGITAGNQKLTVEVAAAQTGGAPTTFTVVAYGPTEATCTVTSPATTCDLTGLTNGQSYTVTVRAENAGGFSGFSTPETATPEDPTPPGPGPTPPLPSKPSAPGSVKLDPGPARIGVSWSAATAPSDAPVLFYRATATPGGQSCQTSAPITSCMITGLTNGTAYSVAVTALNAGGVGPAASAGPVTPASEAPARPGRPTVKAGNAQVTVTVQPGSGGAEAGSYTATASPGGQSCTVTAPGLTCVITGLTNGTDYTVSVVAANGAGSSEASPASESVTPNGDLPEAPATPARPTAVAGDSSATVTVRAGSGGGEAEKFVVTAAPGGATCTITTPDTSCEVTGLTNGTGYIFSAVATNAGGSSEPSEPSAPVTPQVEAPGPPASVRVLVGDGQATIFATPSDEGGPTERFVVISSPGPKACVITLPATSCVITGLTNGTAYTFAVSASNAGGSTPAPSPTAPVTPEPALDPEPVPLVDPPGPGESQGTEDGEPVADLTVAPDRTGTGLLLSSPTFTLGVEGVDRRGNPVGLQNDQVLLLVDDGRARTEGTGFRPGSLARVFLNAPTIGDGSMLRLDAPRAMDLGQLRVDDVGDFAGTVNLPADLAPGDYVLQVTGVTQNNGERAVSLGVRVVDNNATITLVKGTRAKVSGRLDRVRSTGTSEGVPAGTKLTPYYRFGKRGEFKRGVATIVVQDDGSFRWSRKVGKGKVLSAYVSFASAESNTVKWRLVR